MTGRTAQHHEKTHRPIRLGAGLVATVLLAGCAAAPPPDEKTAQTVAEILATPAVEAVETRRCLQTYAYHTVQVLDPQYVLFSGIGDKHWLNQLRVPCVGLHRTDTLVFKLHTTQVCSLDSFEGVSDPWWWFNRTTGACVLGDFQPVTAHQVELLRAALEGKRRGARSKVEPSAEGG